MKRINMNHMIKILLKKMKIAQDIIFKEKVGDIPLRIYFENSIPQNAELSTGISIFSLKSPYSL